MLFDETKLSDVIVAFDLEGTITAAETWRGMRDYLRANGRSAEFRRFFLRHLPGVIGYRLGLLRDMLAFKERWVLGILALYGGMSRAQLEEMGDWVAEQVLWPSRRQAVVVELEAHRENGRSVIIVSGMFEPILAPIAAKLGVQAMGTPLLFEGDLFTGRADGPLNVGERKVARLEQLLGNGRTLHAAYGDTRRDIPMLHLSQEPVAVHSDAALRREAEANGWRVLA
jgi:HAD superfamily phosphoserine phosphatase-like hydrolase